MDRKKLVLFRIILLIQISALIAAIILLTHKSFVLGGLLLLIVLISLPLLGYFIAAPTYLEGSLINLLKSQGGRMPYKDVIEWFRMHFEKGKDQKIIHGVVDTASSILGKLRKRKIVKIDNGMVYLIRSDEGKVK